MIRTRGFSLIEMLTVLAIMGILVTLSFQSFNWLSANTKVKSASTDLYLALIRTRNEAVKRNRMVEVVKKSSGWQAGWQIISADETGSFTGTNSRLVQDIGALSRVTVAGTLDSVVFLPSGRIQNGATPVFTITSQQSSSMKRCVSANLMGQPYVKDPGTGACS